MYLILIIFVAMINTEAMKPFLLIHKDTLFELHLPYSYSPSHDDLIQLLGFKHHLYTDDSQIYI